MQGGMDVRGILRKELIIFFGFLSLILNTEVLPNSVLGTKEVEALLDRVYHFCADFSLSVFHL